MCNLNNFWCLFLDYSREKYTPKGKGLKSLIQKENEKYASDEGIDFISKMLSIFPVKIDIHSKKDISY